MLYHIEIWAQYMEEIFITYKSIINHFTFSFLFFLKLCKLLQMKKKIFNISFLLKREKSEHQTIYLALCTQTIFSNFHIHGYQIFVKKDNDIWLFTSFMFSFWFLNFLSMIILDYCQISKRPFENVYKLGNSFLKISKTFFKRHFQMN